MANFHEFDFVGSRQRPFHDLLAALLHLVATAGKADLAASSAETLRQITALADPATTVASAAQAVNPAKLGGLARLRSCQPAALSIRNSLGAGIWNQEPLNQLYP